MIERSIEFVQPYYVGQRDKKSLAVIIPAKIARQCQITPDTLFSVKGDRTTKAVTLQTVKLTEDGDENKKAGAVEVGHLTATAL